MSFPEDLYKEIVKAHGPSVAEEICKAQNERALLTVRANTIKTSRDAVISLTG
jgi:16S rRNA C967 or C1407 C5-methylase (RsmB/RsmF family)